MMTLRPRIRQLARCGPIGAAVALGAVALLASACSSSSSATTTTTIPSTATSTSTTTTTTTTGGSTTTTGAPSTPAISNLAATGQVKAGLIAAFVAMKQIPAADVPGTAPGTVYYAYDSTTKTYWAFADFDLASNASYQTQVGFQDGGSQGLFSMTAGSPWFVQTGGNPTYCDQASFFPAAVLAVWNIAKPTGMSC
jgi:hypothetical protein